MKKILFSLLTLCLGILGFFILDGVLGWLLRSEGRGISLSAKESQEYGLLVRSVKPLKLSYKYGDSIHFIIKESFIESNWRHNRDGGVLDKIPGHDQLVIKCRSGSKLIGLGSSWFINSDENKMTETGSDGLIYKNVNMIPNDPIKFYLTVGPRGIKGVVIDSLVFY